MDDKKLQIYNSIDIILEIIRIYLSELRNFKNKKNSKNISHCNLIKYDLLFLI